MDSSNVLFDFAYDLIISLYIRRSSLKLFLNRWSCCTWEIVYPYDIFIWLEAKPLFHDLNSVYEIFF